MKLAVLGATGPSGQCVVEQALEAGHHVNALVRNSNKVTVQHKNLQVLNSNIFSEESLTKDMEGCDAVISCLGSSSLCCSRVTLYTESIVTITAAMRACGIKRLITMTAAYTLPSDGEPWWVSCFMRGMFLNGILADMADMEDYLHDTCMDITWTAVKPPGLTLKPLDSRHPGTFEGQYVPESINQIPRANVAKFMLEQLKDNSWHNKIVAIGFLKGNQNSKND